MGCFFAAITCKSSTAAAATIACALTLFGCLAERATACERLAGGYSCKLKNSNRDFPNWPPVQYRKAEEMYKPFLVTIQIVRMRGGHNQVRIGGARGIELVFMGNGEESNLPDFKGFAYFPFPDEARDINSKEMKIRGVCKEDEILWTGYHKFSRSAFPEGNNGSDKGIPIQIDGAARYQSRFARYGGSYLLEMWVMNDADRFIYDTQDEFQCTKVSGITR
jgi:hypothetical protein